MQKSIYIHFFKKSIFIFLLHLTNNDLIAHLNQYNPIFEKDQKKKKEILENAVKRFVLPLNVYFNGEMSEKIFLSISIIGLLLFYNLSKNKDTGEKEGTHSANKLYHFFLFSFLFQWLVLGPAKVFIDSYLEEYDRKFKAPL